MHVPPANAATLRQACREPLTSLTTAVDLLAASSDPRERQQQLVLLRDGCERMARTLDDLDLLDRLHAGTPLRREEPFALAPLLFAAAAPAVTAAGARGLTFHVEVAPAVPAWVEGDPELLHRLVARLADLAAQRTAIGSAALTVTALGHRIGITVQDRGASDLGELRARADLGLAASLAAAMGGMLHVEPRPSGGLQVHAELPLRATAPLPASAAEEAAELPAPATAVRGRVLLVEDSKDQQLLIGRLLARAGAQVAVADHGAIALQLVAEQPFDLVLLDMRMPELDGYATAQRLRERGCNLPIIALTADDVGDDAARCLAAGCNAHLHKPVSRQQLLQTLAMFLPGPTS